MGLFSKSSRRTSKGSLGLHVINILRFLRVVEWN